MKILFKHLENFLAVAAEFYQNLLKIKKKLFFELSCKKFYRNNWRKVFANLP